MISNNEAPYQFSKQPSNPATDFNYTVLESETRIVVQQHTYEIKSLMRRTANDIIRIGQKLKEVKAQLGHGHFRTWLNAEFDWSIWTATKFMQVADKFKCVKFSHLDIAPSALYELAAPSTPDFVRFEAIERASQGETITHSLAKALKAELIARQSEQVNDPPLSESIVTIDINAEALDNPSTTPSLPEVMECLNPLLESQVFDNIDTFDNQLIKHEAQKDQGVEQENSLRDKPKLNNLEEISQPSLISVSTDVNEIYIKLIDSAKAMNIEALNLIEESKLHSLIDISNLLIKRAEIALNTKR
ncbi:DUF3102 domain-containing protein [Synechocystis sp. PCC 7509]|uniref:DUF3102 domain-containing protein n=1 Tax=Synechocystis sp. PCC 7509 TaxID=927677 RepID=UPI0002AC9300|nr:DUF3102 domain-containing protein [Synechocystis sp. PCC 7509]